MVRVTSFISNLNTQLRKHCGTLTVCPWRIKPTHAATRQHVAGGVADSTTTTSSATEEIV